MKTKYTSGPWRVDVNPYDNENRVYQAKENGIPIINALFKSTGPESEANARLIARAPTMDTALRSVLVNLALAEKSGTEITWYLRLAREAAAGALTKVEGK